MPMEEFIQIAEEFGIFSYYLPFILMFAIFYGLLGRAQIFGDPKTEKSARVINLVISGAASFFILTYTPLGITLATFLSNFFGRTLVIFLTLLGLAIVVYILGGTVGLKADELKQKAQERWWIFLILGAVLIGGIFVSAEGYRIFPGVQIKLPVLSIEAWTLIILAVVTIIIIAVLFAAGEGRPTGEGKPS